jgi:SAM-dependent methyltransferase
MADRLRSDGPVVLIAPVPDWLLPAPFAEVTVASAGMAEWVRSRGRRPILAPAAPESNSPYSPSPSHGLESLSEGLGKSAVDLGCGAGRDAFWLQQHGWKVLGVDRLPPQADIPFVQANLHEFWTEDRFDLVMLHYCWDPEYFKLALRLCSEGGRVSILAHSELNWRCFGHPRKTKTLAKGDPRAICPSHFELIHEEEFWSLDRHSVRIVLECRK